MSNHCRYLASGYPRVPLKNGIGRVIGQLKRVTIKFCKSHGSSQGIRNFIEQDLLDFSRTHPDVVVYVKPRRHHSPVVVAEYLNGEKQYMSFHQFTRDETLMWLNHFTNRVGVPTVRYRKLLYTECPSIQGVWSPFTFRDPALNLETFPNPKFTIPENMPPTATERLRELFERQKLREENEKNLNVKNEEIEVQS
ncbi:large ribosomal subunit protein mL43 [Planococcus citri]|uniref:large ribosomal subunit protein mL43 n=1 Tax=Planococcus citri TaxID=170843 RepID=UPI0031FA4310